MQQNIVFFQISRPKGVFVQNQNVFRLYLCVKIHRRQARVSRKRFAEIRKAASAKCKDGFVVE